MRISFPITGPVSAGPVLKTAIFATGLAGIVAEFVLSTLATYLLGNAVFQWTVVMSLMLFAMGLGSRLSKAFTKNLLESFIAVEFLLSILCASSSCLAYGLSAHTSNLNLVIYSLAFCIGLLIGLEIPLVTRLNQTYEELRTNIATVLEKDYYGSLLGGAFFAFFALPYLGLTYTPIALGAVNFLVALLVLFGLGKLVGRKRVMNLAALGTGVFLISLAFLAEPIVTFGEQAQYRDKVIFAKQTVYQKIVITRWRGDHWLFINGQEQFSTVDEERYHEPLVHPAMLLAEQHKDVLILGGGDGLALREILKHKGVRSVTMVDLDPAMTDLAVSHPVLHSINRGSMEDKRLKVINRDAAQYLKNSSRLFDVIIIDLPDPDSNDLMNLYSLGFYRLVNAHLSPGGLMVTQATSTFFSPKAFQCILKTVRAAGFAAVPYHNQVPTMGEWGWVLAGRKSDFPSDGLKKRFEAISLGSLPTRFLTDDAARAMASFGKNLVEEKSLAAIEINTQHRPVLGRYYQQERWEVYQ